MDIGRYQVVGELGRGNFGVVYSAVDSGLNRAVAIKALLDPGAGMAELVREGRILAGLNHPNIVSVLDAFLWEGRLMIVMEKVAGETLEKWVRNGPARGVLERVLILEQIADALSHAHLAKVQHRDLKPANVMVTPEGVAKILDFGVAKRLDGTGVVVRPSTVFGGTLSYMAPEQLILGISGFASDVFAFGVVAYELLSGRHPFPGTTEYLIQNAIVNLAPAALGSVVDGLPAPAILVIEKCLEKALERRYATLTEVDRELRRAVFPLKQMEARRLAAEGLAALKQGRERAEKLVEAAEKFDRGCGELLQLQAWLGGAPMTAPLHANPPPVVAAPRPALISVPSPAVTIADLEVRTNRIDGLRYVRIPAGTFRMGCSPGDGECHPNEKPAHEVRISEAFWMGQTAVTVGAYRRFAAATGKAMPSLTHSGDSLPMTAVNWAEAQGYCEWAGMRLPTEAEWEYAARAGTTGARYAELENVAWYRDNSDHKPHPVGQKTPNGFKLYDMLGNVWEWTADWYEGTYTGSSPVIDPTGPSTGERRVLRGGSWVYIASSVRASNRGSNLPAVRNFNIGVRCTGELPVP